MGFTALSTRDCKSLSIDKARSIYKAIDIGYDGGYYLQGIPMNFTEEVHRGGGGGGGTPLNLG